MSTVAEILKLLAEFAPVETAMSWDNVGLLLGDPEQQVQSVLVSLDVTQGVVQEAIEKGCQLIISHHPLMNCKWLPVQSIRIDKPQGKLFTTLLRSHISVISMHTNLDLASGGVNDKLAEKLGLLEVDVLSEDGLCRVGNLAEPMPLNLFAAQVAERLSCSGLRYSDGGKTVSRVAVGGGACVEYAAQALEKGCDTFVTSDIKYHEFLDAAADGINLIDAGHFPTENPVCQVLVDLLARAFPDLSVESSKTHKEVIQYYYRGE